MSMLPSARRPPHPTSNLQWPPPIFKHPFIPFNSFIRDIFIFGHPSNGCSTLRHLCDHAQVWQPQKIAWSPAAQRPLHVPHLCPWLLFIPLPCLQRLRSVISSFVFHLIHNVLPRPHCSFTALILSLCLTFPCSFLVFCPVLLWIPVPLLLRFSRVLCSLVPLGRKCGFAPRNFST